MSIPNQYGLFDPPPSPFRAHLAERLSQLSRRGVYIGTSSWKYPGWMGQIYTPERYQTRGRFSQSRFEQTCLAEYGETFPIVCGDFSFYQFPSPDFWAKLFRSAPPALRFAFKVPEEITVQRFPLHARYGARAGMENAAFLDVEMFGRLFLEALNPYQERVAVLIFEFGERRESAKGAAGASRQARNSGLTGADGSSVLREFSRSFDRPLEEFLRQLPKGWRYSVEIRNREFMDEEYFGCLRRHGVAHVFSAWTRMPELAEQIAMPGAHTADFTVTRALLRAGRPYEMAVKKFQPYAEVQEENPGAREALRRIIHDAGERKQNAFIFVNNRLEGNAPGTVAAVVGGD
ncbi:MAG: DUF72 domain-containing protein [Acidobacteriia bacterium]|nr:DUF72 domain-containing protein [Terriglobia bacterium]